MVRPSPIERAAAAAILVALVAFSLQRVSAVDLPWHLATARLARVLGHWPLRNTFSYTFPDHPLYQQYPGFQAALYAVFERWGFAGLSIFGAVGWIAVFLAFVRWAGPLRNALARPLLWAVGLYALQRRMSLRPELFTMLALAAMLHALDGFARGRRWAIAAVPLIHYAWLRSHQMFPVSLLVQALFVAHLALARGRRWRVDDTDAAVPLWPAALTLAASTALCLATPFGVHVFEGVAHTARTLATFRADVAELGRIWDQPYELSLALVSGGWTAWMLWRARHRWAPFDVGLYLLSAALVVSAARGLLFYGILSVAIAQRTSARLAASGVPPGLDLQPRARQLLRLEAALASLVLALGGVYEAWLRPASGASTAGGIEFGVGRSVREWRDDAIAFLRANPPPGRMMNLPWASGNALIWGLPEQPVFVDPRLESYPWDFLREVVASYHDDARLAALVDRYQPSWIFAEHAHAAIRDRLATLARQGWESVYRDAAIVVLVRPGADTAAYRAAHHAPR